MMLRNLRCEHFLRRKKYKEIYPLHLANICVFFLNRDLKKNYDLSNRP